MSKRDLYLFRRLVEKIRHLRDWSSASWASLANPILCTALFIVAFVFEVPNANAQMRTPQSVESVPGQFVISLKKPKDGYNQRNLEQSLNARIVEQIRSDMIVIQRDPNESLNHALSSLKAESVVSLVDPNYIYRASRTPNDTDYLKLWGLSNGGHKDSEGILGVKGIDISAEKAWAITTGSKKVIVAVIDTGVDFSIPDLKNNAWVNKAEKDGLPGVDDDGNGFIDDIHGFNFVGNNGEATDDNGHGSHCAGTIGAEGDDQHGVVGVAWNVSIMALKFLDSNGGGSLANAIKAIDYARLNGAHILSNSWGGGGRAANLEKAIEETRDAGQLFIAASGNEAGDNDKRPTYPASFPVDNIVSVAAVGNRGDLAFFSNYGLTTVHLAAPGLNIYSTIPGGFDTYSGTSMAAPHVSGIAALMLTMNPAYSYSEIKEKLIQSSRPIIGLKGRVIAGGMVDAYYALTDEEPPSDPNDPSEWTASEFKVATPHPYPLKWKETYTVHIAGAQRIAVKFTQFETEANFDKVTFTDKEGNVIGLWSGKNNERFSPVADGDTLNISIDSDTVQNAYGFEVEQVFHK